jgi:hypothetical protein
MPQCLGIQSGKGQKPSIQCVFGSKDIGGIGLRQLPFGKKADLIDQTWEQNISAERLTRGAQ